MSVTPPILKACKKGHKFFKSSNCSTCPICEKQTKPNEGFLSLIAAPARRALEKEGITTLKDLSMLSISEILKLHGLGKSSIPKLKDALLKEGLFFREDEK